MLPTKPRLAKPLPPGYVLYLLDGRPAYLARSVRVITIEGEGPLRRSVTTPAYLVAYLDRGAPAAARVPAQTFNERALLAVCGHTTAKCACTRRDELHNSSPGAGPYSSPAARAKTAAAAVASARQADWPPKGWVASPSGAGAAASTYSDY